MAERNVSEVSSAFSNMPNEIFLHIFSFLTFPSIISARAVCRRWRSLIPQALKPLYRTLLSEYLSNSVPLDLAEHLQVSLDQRQAFVDHIECNNKVKLPSEFRAILLEWPSKYPPSSQSWPDPLSWYANKVCTRCLSKSDICVCYHPELVSNCDITLTKSVFSAIINHQPIPVFNDDSFVWELFNNPPRLTGELREEQTKRMIRLYADTMKQRADSSLWLSLYIDCLPLNVYKSESDEDEGWFYLILSGDARGEIHGWRTGWYDGWEANSFLDFFSRRTTKD